MCINISLSAEADFHTTVEAVMLTHGLSAVGKRDVRQRLVGMAEDSGTSRRDIKLCYVTVNPVIYLAALSLMHLMSSA